MLENYTANNTRPSESEVKKNVKKYWDNVHKICWQRGYSLSELEKKAGFATNFIATASNKGSNPLIVPTLKIQKALGCTLKDLIYGEDSRGEDAFVNEERQKNPPLYIKLKPLLFKHYLTFSVSQQEMLFNLTHVIVRMKPNEPFINCTVETPAFVGESFYASSYDTDQYAYIASANGMKRICYEAKVRNRGLGYEAKSMGYDRCASIEKRHNIELGKPANYLIQYLCDFADRYGFSPDEAMRDMSDEWTPEKNYIGYKYVYGYPQQRTKLDKILYLFDYLTLKEQTSMYYRIIRLVKINKKIED